MASRIIVPVAILLLLAGIVTAVVLILLPLPTLNAFGGQTGWCGPGYSSDNALQVELNPDLVNSGDASGNGASDGSYQQLQAFKAFCVGEADTRFMEAGAALVAGVIFGAGGIAVALYEQRRVRILPGLGWYPPYS